MTKVVYRAEVIRVLARVLGVVQGVGFRPFVYRLAKERGLTGFVRNDGRGVIIELEGPRDLVEEALAAIKEDCPPAARVDRLEPVETEPAGYSGFEIEESAAGDSRRALVSPDIAVCANCRRELGDPGDRRFRYPFINCTDCGPRFTIITGVPYDRPRTTMAAFEMCPDCEAEYRNPADRRFHAQPVACPGCGPCAELLDREGRPVPTQDPVAVAGRLLREGFIVAVKGLGGFHLACDARNASAVEKLRGRKVRESKPFALMARDLETIKRYCYVDEAEKALLLSRRAPIVLLRKRADELPPAIAPGHRYLGFMLPYTPLHCLLFEGGPDVLVMTSGNRSDEPIAYVDEEAFRRLADIADYYLTHDRPIYRRVDDSVTRVFRGAEMLIRRSRGYVPEPLDLPLGFAGSILGCGAEVKNTFCLTKGPRAFVSHYIGDLINAAAVSAYEEGVKHFKELFDVEPTVAAHDMHPDYFATRYAEGLEGVQRIPVQHHHAHIAAVLGENGFEGPVVGLAWDGAGYGTDGTVWGGEVLVATAAGFERVGRLRPVKLAGGDAAVREPWRVAAGYITDARGADSELLGSIFPNIPPRLITGVLTMLRKELGVVESSSAGRLFDFTAAVLGFSGSIDYEGQAAVELEQYADPSENGYYPFDLTDGSPFEVDWRPTVAAVLDDVRAHVEPARVSARFHNGAARMLEAAARRARDLTGISAVALSGGVFQNVTLLDRALPRLEGAGFKVLMHRYIPPNDSCISFGQAVVAAAKMAGEVD